MEQMPYRPELDQAGAATWREPAAAVTSTDWRTGLPALTGKGVAMRELRASDAAPLCALLTTPEVSRFISPPPTTVDGFERFIAWTHRQRAAGAYVCFAVTLEGFDTAIGLFQIRALNGDFSTAEWGFALGSAFWGTGVFGAAAEAVLDFAFDVMGVQRLEARAAIRNGRGNGALVKLGAVQEALLRRSFLRNGEYLDQALYAIIADDWTARRAASRQVVRSSRSLVH